MITINDENETNEIFALMAEYAAMRQELDPLINRMKEHEKRIKELAADLGDSVAHVGVKATPRDGSEYHYWNTKALLDQLERTPWLEKFHEVRERKGSVAISFNG
jgi:hypothetical protein